jgi:hypothetical protein
LVLSPSPLENEASLAGLPIPGVLVSISGAAEHQCSTDLLGRCLFSNLPGGAVELLLEKPGFHPNVYIGLALSPGQNLEHHMCLAYASSETVIMITQVSLPR